MGFMGDPEKATIKSRIQKRLSRGFRAGEATTPLKKEGPPASSSKTRSSNKRPPANASSSSKRMSRKGSMLSASLNRSSQILKNRGASLKRHSSGAVGYFKNKIKSKEVHRSYLDYDSRPSSRPSTLPPGTRVAQNRKHKSAPVDEGSSTQVDRRIQRRKELRQQRFTEALERRKSEHGDGMARPRRKSSMSSVSSVSSKRSFGASATQENRKANFTIARHARVSRHARNLEATSNRAKRHAQDDEYFSDEEEAEYHEQEMEYLNKRKSMTTTLLHYVIDEGSDTESL